MNEIEPAYDHEAVVNHECGDYDLTDEQCVRSEACAQCGVRRDEHASESMPHQHSNLDITDHKWEQPTS